MNDGCGKSLITWQSIKNKLSSVSKDCFYWSANPCQQVELRTMSVTAVLWPDCLPACLPSSKIVRENDSLPFTQMMDGVQKLQSWAGIGGTTVTWNNICVIPSRNTEVEWDSIVSLLGTRLDKKEHFLQF